MTHPAKLYFECTYKKQSYIFIGIDSRGAPLYNLMNFFSNDFIKKENAIFNDRKFISDTYEEIADSLSRTYPSAKVYCCGNELSYISNDNFLNEVYLAPPSSKREFPGESNADALYKFISNRKNLSSLFNEYLNISNYPISSIFVNKLKNKGLEIDTMTANLFFQHRYWLYFKEILYILSYLFFLASTKSYLIATRLSYFLTKTIDLLSFQKKISDIFNLVSSSVSLKIEPYIGKSIYAPIAVFYFCNLILDTIIKKFIPNYDTLKRFLSQRKLSFDFQTTNHPFYLKKQILNPAEKIEEKIASLSEFSELNLAILKEVSKTIKDEKFKKLCDRIQKIEFNDLENELFDESEAALLENMLKDDKSAFLFDQLKRRSFESLSPECLSTLESISLLKWEKAYYAEKIKSIIEKNTSEKEVGSNAESRPLIFLIDEDYLNQSHNSIINQLEFKLSGFKLQN